MVRDFEFKLRRQMLLRVIEMEDIEKILFIRSSCFIFNVLTNLTPSNFAGTLISKGYYNERAPGKLSFFDANRSRFGKAGLSNCVSRFTNEWTFDWYSIELAEFKRNLAALPSRPI